MLPAAPEQVPKGASISCVESCACPQQDAVLEGAKANTLFENGPFTLSRSVALEGLRRGKGRQRGEVLEGRLCEDDRQVGATAVQRAACESVIEDALKDVANGLKGEREWRSTPFLEWFAKFVKGCAKEAAKKKQLEAGAPSTEEDLALRAACRLRFGEVRPNGTSVRLKKLSEDPSESLAEVEEASRLKEIGAAGGDGKAVFVDEIAPWRFEFLIARSSVVCQPLSLSKQKASAQGEGRMLPCKGD